MKAMGLQQDGKTGVPVWHKSENRKKVPVFREKRDRKGENVMKKQNKSSIVWYILSVIAMIFLTMRVAMNWELKGAVLVFFILGIVIEIIWIAKNIIKFFREYE